jgi:hypothetical protein
VSKTSYTIAANSSLYLSSGYGTLPACYLITTNGIISGALSAAIGSGYGKETTRHKVVELIQSASITYTVDNNVYGLTIANNTGQQISVSVITLM